jgi:hypothetical protein
MFQVKLKRMFWEQDLFSASGTAVNGVSPHQSFSQCLAQRIGMGLLVAPNWTPAFLTFLARTGTHPVPETLCFYVFKASTTTEYNKIFWG